VSRPPLDLIFEALERLYLQSVIEDLARSDAARPASLQEVESTLDALAEMGKDLPHLPSSAFSRESIYQDHD
jgi:hypothetical protein